MVFRVTRKKSQQKSREDWVFAAAELLAEGGIEAVRVEPLARRLGVTKGSFYWHFDGRPDLHRAILEVWEQVGTLGIIDAVEAAGGDPLERLRHLWSLTNDDRFGAELAIRDWSRRDESVRAIVQRVDNRRMGYLRALYRQLGWTPVEAEARSLLAYSLLIGDYFIAADHPDGDRSDIVAAALSMLNLQAPTEDR